MAYVLAIALVGGILKAVGVDGFWWVLGTFVSGNMVALPLSARLSR
ncbi:MAG: hypothetical protein Q7T55_15660 [Solirubrobacteraceae bacterium]|nr:hypothetical protein [Solirubrobacteraceae bacterium]